MLGWVLPQPVSQVIRAYDQTGCTKRAPRHHTWGGSQGR